jgi:hypothetical protein
MNEATSRLIVARSSRQAERIDGELHHLASVGEVERDERQQLRASCARQRCGINYADIQLITEARVGFEHWTVRCKWCGRIDQVQMNTDPLKSDALGCMKGELRPPH